MGNGGNVTNEGNLETGGVDRAHGGFTTGTRSLHVDTHSAHAVVLSLAGGLFGMGLSFGMRELIPVLFSDMDVRSIIPVWLVVVGLGFSGIVALLSALAPAIGAMRISPLEAIRAE